MEHYGNPRQAYSGFTFVELMVTIAIVGLILAKGVPALSFWTSMQKTKTTILRVGSDLMYARQTAVNYSQRVTICPLENEKCEKKWRELPYSVFIDLPPLGEFNVNTDILLREEQDHLAIGVLDFNGGSKIVFDQLGQLDSASGTFQFCLHSDSTGEQSKALIVSLAGRTRASTDVDDDGFDEKNYADKKSDLKCPFPT